MRPTWPGRFLRSPKLLLEIDRIARRYGCMPHEVMQLSPTQWTLARLCLIAAHEETEDRAKRGAMGVIVVGEV